MVFLNRLHIFFDTETTGLGDLATPPREDAIVEVGMAYRFDGKIITYGNVCKPYDYFFADGRADEALKVSGITMEEISKAKSEYDIAEEVRTILNKLILVERQDIVLHSYNIPFDQSFLEDCPWSLGFYDWGEDVMDLAFRHFQLPTGYKIGLARTLERLGIKPQGKPHRAVTDAVSAMLVYEKIKEIEGVN